MDAPRRGFCLCIGYEGWLPICAQSSHFGLLLESSLDFGASDKNTAPTPFFMMTPQKIRHLFESVSGIRLRHAAITYLVDDRMVVEFSGINHSGPFLIRSLPFTGSVADQVKKTAMLARTQSPQRNDVLETVAEQIDFGGVSMAQLSGNLANMVRDTLSKAKERSAKSHAEFGKAVTEFANAHDEIDAASKAISKETAELKQSIAGLTNEVKS